MYKEINAENLATTTLNNLKRAKDMLTNFEWEESILNDTPKDPSGLPEPGEGVIKTRRFNQHLELRNAS